MHLVNKKCCIYYSICVLEKSGENYVNKLPYIAYISIFSFVPSMKLLVFFRLYWRLIVNEAFSRVVACLLDAVSLVLV